VKVNNSNVNPKTVQGPAATGVESKGKAKNKSVSGDLASLGSSKVNVSDRAQAMKKAKDIASGTSVDEAKVAKFQALIDSGKYKVDAEAVADRLVDDHLGLVE
jgi:negative regulator of flagellin synthesis FlgM